MKNLKEIVLATAITAIAISTTGCATYVTNKTSTEYKQNAPNQEILYPDYNSILSRMLVGL